MSLPHPLTVLHTNDFHNHFSQEAALKLKEEKQTSEHAILLDAGDVIKTGNIGVPLAEEAVWSHLKTAGYDAVTMGNREFHVSALGLKAKLKGAPCPILCANIYDKSSQPLDPPVAPFIELQIGQAKVILFGLTVPMVTPRMKAQAISRYLFEMPLSCAQELVPILRPQCDFLIALTHIGHRQDQLLAQACPQIDLIVGGHSHTILETPERVGNVLIAQTGSHGRFYGKLVFQPNGETKGELLPLKTKS